jgi:nicotinate-nucleotide pyrophosphorylase (carboxylating)
MLRRLLPFQIQPMVQQALREDLSAGDITTDLLPDIAHRQIVATLRTRQACVVSGLEVGMGVFMAVDDQLRCEPVVENGQHLSPGQVLMTIRGSASSVLKAERTALNFMQHAAGVATCTARFVHAIAGTDACVTDTRKTTPGLRALEKLAVIHGGGRPHRYNLGSAVMLKDNHIQAAGGIIAAVRQIREQASHTVKIEVEVDTLDQVEDALAAQADIILLDNFSLEDLRTAVGRIARLAVTEASGGITLDTIREVAETGVQFISTSQITISAGAVDLGLDF